MGGLGNQLFQYYFGEFIKCNHNAEVYYVIDWYTNQSTNAKPITKRALVLDKVVASPKLITLSTAIEAGLSLIASRTEEFSYDSNLYIGYFQTPTFTPSSEKLRKYFPKSSSYESYCALHIRGGDFKKLGLCISQEYYNNVINKLPRDLPLKIFSDDYEFASKIIQNIDINGRTVLAFSSHDQVKDFKNICTASHIVCANSTYSLNAAIIASAHGSTCFAPDPRLWFTEPGENQSKINNITALLHKHNISILS